MFENYVDALNWVNERTPLFEAYDHHPSVHLT